MNLLLVVRSNIVKQQYEGDVKRNVRTFTHNHHRQMPIITGGELQMAMAEDVKLSRNDWGKLFRVDQNTVA